MASSDARHGRNGIKKCRSPLPKVGLGSLELRKVIESFRRAEIGIRNKNRASCL